jgi:hypothetical protein
LQEGSITNFGLFIAYVLPGFTALQGLPFFLSSPAAWGNLSRDVNPTATTFLSGTVEAALAALTVSTVLWLVVDTLHHRTGLCPPRWDFALLTKNVAVFEFLVHIHYKYYKFYSLCRALHNPC